MCDMFRCPSFPRAVRVSEIHLHPRLHRELDVLGHLLPLIVREGAAEGSGKVVDLPSEGTANLNGLLPEQCLPRLFQKKTAVFFWNMRGWRCGM